MDKKQKKQVRNAWQVEQHADARSKLPLPKEEFEALFDMLDVELRQTSCAHTRRLTEAWLTSRGHDVVRVCEWLGENGGYCDCEVLANCEQAVEEALHSDS